MCHLIYDYNEILKLYINVKQQSSPELLSTTGQLSENKSACSELIHEKKELTNKKNVITDITNCLLECFNTNKNGCIFDFTTYDNLDHSMMNPNKENNKIEPTKDTYFDSLIEQFFNKLNETSLKNKENCHALLRYSILDFYNSHDLLEEYEKKKDFHRIKSCALKSYQSKTMVNRNVTTKQLSELTKWKNKTTGIKVLKIEKLREVLKYARTKKLPLENTLKKNNCPFYTFIAIDIVRQKNYTL